MTIKSCRDTDDIERFVRLKGCLNLVQKGLPVCAFGMEVDHLFGTTERIRCSIPIVKGEIKNEGALDHSFTKELLDGNGNVIKVTEAPAGMGTGMMPRRPDETEGGLIFKNHFRCQNRPACCEDTNFINLWIAFNGLDVLSSVNPLQVSFCGRFWLDELKFLLQSLHDGLHPPRSRRRIGCVDFIKSWVEDDLHVFLSPIKNGNPILPHFVSLVYIELSDRIKLTIQNTDIQYIQAVIG